MNTASKTRHLSQHSTPLLAGNVVVFSRSGLQTVHVVVFSRSGLQTARVVL